jgi:uncharacterized membrane protein YtjA (UPF0391 family)
MHPGGEVNSYASARTICKHGLFRQRVGTNRNHPRFYRIIRRRCIMLYWALVFLVVAIIAGALGFGGIAGTSAGIAQILFFIFLAFLVISLLAGLFKRAS